MLVREINKFDEIAFNEDFDEMLPYFKKLILKSNKATINSELKFLEIQLKKIELTIVNNDKINNNFVGEKIATDNFYSIKGKYEIIIRKYYFSYYANEIQKKFLEEGNEKYSHYWKYEIRNFYFYNIASDIYSIFDYILYFINCLSNYSIVKKDRNVNFKNMKEGFEKLYSNKKEIGYIKKEDVEIIKKIFEDIENIHKDQKHSYLGTLKDNRNKSQHRFTINPDEIINSYTKIEDGYSFDLKNNLKYEEYIEVIYKNIKSVDDILMSLIDLSIFKFI